MKGRLNNWMIDDWWLMIEWMIEWLNDWMIEWLNDWMIGFMDDWMIGFMND